MKKLSILKFAILPAGILGTLAGSIVLASCGEQPIVLEKVMAVNIGNENCQYTCEFNDDLYGHVNIEWSEDGSNWHKLEFRKIKEYSGYMAKATFPANSKIYFKGNNPHGLCSKYNDNVTMSFKTKKPITLSGNVMSLLDNGTDTIHEIPSSYCFRMLFGSGSNISHIDENFLPARKLKDHCYSCMFASALSVVAKEIKASDLPKLPATELAPGCYEKMFGDNSTIYDLGNYELPADKLETDCYKHMFDSCINLRVAPQLKATQLAESCYLQMFNNCSSLKVLPKLPAKKMAHWCYNAMFRKTGIDGDDESYQKLFENVEELAEGCFDGMFVECHNLKWVPSSFNKLKCLNNLPSGCFTRMFHKCDKLNIDDAHPLTLPATTLSTQCYQDMFNECKSLTRTPTMLNLKDIGQEACKHIFYDCENLTNVSNVTFDNTDNGKDTIVREGGCHGMFTNCKSIVEAPILWANQVLGAGYYEMFTNCEKLTEAKIYSQGFTMTQSAYYMFSGCTSLANIWLYNIKKFSGSTMENNATTHWVENVPMEGTFHCLDELWFDVRDNLHFGIDTIPFSDNSPWTHDPLA